MEKLPDISGQDELYNGWMRLLLANRAIFKSRERELSEYGITPEQAGLLFIIDHKGEDATISEMARLTIREPHTVWGIVQRMEKKEFITKVRKSNNSKVIRFAITEKGKLAYLQSCQRLSIHHIFSELSPEERHQLSASLGKLLHRAYRELNNYHKS